MAFEDTLFCFTISVKSPVPANETFSALNMWACIFTHAIFGQFTGTNTAVSSPAELKHFTHILSTLGGTEWSDQDVHATGYTSPSDIG